MDRDAIPGPGTFSYEEQCSVLLPAGRFKHRMSGSVNLSPGPALRFPLAVLASLFASIALAQFLTNPRSMVAFSKIVSIYPSSAAAYDDPFFSAAPTQIEDAAKPIAKDIVSKYADIVPTVPKKADVNAIVLTDIEQALAGKMSAQDALNDAVTKSNALIK